MPEGFFVSSESLQSRMREALAGDVEAMIEVADSLSATARNSNSEESVPELAVEMYEMAIGAGSTTAYVHWSLELHRFQRTDEAIHLLTKGATTGDSEIYWNLGGMLWSLGRMDESEPWLRRAAENGHVLAMVSLGIVLQQSGCGEDACSWWRKAADLGNGDSMINLGLFEFEILGESSSGARFWFEQAMEVGHPKAAELLEGLNRAETGAEPSRRSHRSLFKRRQRE